jgi:hypothetical protein
MRGGETCTFPGITRNNPWKYLFSLSLAPRAVPMPSVWVLVAQLVATLAVGIGLMVLLTWMTGGTLGATLGAFGVGFFVGAH